MELAVGKDLFAVCGKCDATWHVIVSMDGAKVTRVQCKQCMGYHRYKAAPGELDVNKAARDAAKKTAAPRRRKVGTKAVPAAPVVVADMSRPPKVYSIKETFETADRIMHPKFGEGVVEELPEPGKITVSFPTGRRTLIHNRR